MRHTKSSCRCLLLSIIALTVTSLVVRSAEADGLPPTPAEANHSVVFIHSGCKGVDQKIVDGIADKVANDLARLGYLVRSPDKEQDVVGGQGVDYFFDTDLAVAQHVAAVANVEMKAANLDPSPPDLGPRRQAVRNHRGYLGVWLCPVPKS
jgi:hypothetical protein